MTEITISILGSPSFSDEIAAALKGHDYAEVERNEMTGTESELSWLVVAILGSPVIGKLLDVLEKAAARKKISKVTVSKDGKVEIEGASPKEAARILRMLEGTMVERDED